MKDEIEIVVEMVEIEKVAEIGIAAEIERMEI